MPPPAVSCPADELAPAAFMICTGEGVVVEGPYANVGTATGDPGVGPIVDETDPSHYLGVALGTDPPVARNDWIQPGCSLSGGGPYSCTVNAPAGTLFADNPGTTASGNAVRRQPRYDRLRERCSPTTPVRPPPVRAASTSTLTVIRSQPRSPASTSSAPPAIRGARRARRSAPAPSCSCAPPTATLSPAAAASSSTPTAALR